jgi:hypothetical protein
MILGEDTIKRLAFTHYQNQIPIRDYPIRMAIFNDQMSTILRSDNYGIIRSNSYSKFNLFNYRTLYESRVKLVEDIIKLKYLNPSRALASAAQKDNINGISNTNLNFEFFEVVFNSLLTEPTQHVNNTDYELYSIIDSNNTTK